MTRMSGIIALKPTLFYTLDRFIFLGIMLYKHLKYKKLNSKIHCQVRHKTC